MELGIQRDPLLESVTVHPGAPIKHGDLQVKFWVETVYDTDHMAIALRREVTHLPGRDGSQPRCLRATPSRLWTKTFTLPQCCLGHQTRG